MTNSYSEDILSNYEADLQVLDMLDWIQNAKNSWENLIPPALDSNTGKNDEQPLD